MTARKHLKDLVRARMARTGERYAAARRQVLREAPAATSPSPAFLHFPGNVPAATALRILLANAGVRAPHTGAPFSEAMCFGIGGGIGAGVFAFHYPKEDVSSFFLAGRHLWQDDLAWMEAALARLGAKAVVKESSGVKPAEKALLELTAGGRPVAAWLDAAGLPHRALPASWSGGGYHVATIYSVDPSAGTALVGDLADDPIPVPLAVLTAARLRIKKFKARLLAIEGAPKPAKLAALVEAGIGACADGLRRGKMKNFTLDAFATWADRLHGSTAADSWEKIFPPGRHLLTGLRSINDFIEHYGTGGGLCRPLFAEFLAEAGAALKDPRLAALGERYAALGRGWSELADAALPDAVPPLAEAKELLARKSELFHSEGAGAEAGIRACWAELETLATRLGRKFPLGAPECEALRKGLQERVRALVAAEREAVEALATLG